MNQILINPIITEKSMSETASGKYTFKVNSKTNKQEVAKAIEKTYKVDVISVNIINVSGKTRRFRFKQVGRTADWKKAIVQLKKGQKISGFEIKEPAKKENPKEVKKEEVKKDK